MSQQLADLTLAEVEDLVPVVAPVLIPIFGPVGLLRYPTKPVSLALQVATVSTFTYLQGSPPMGYEQVVREMLSGEMPQVYTTIKTEQQAEENMMSVVRARSRKATVLPQEYGPINWYKAPVDLHGQPFRFPWSADFIIKVINSSLRVNPNVRPDYKFKFIQVPNRYWKEPEGFAGLHALEAANWLDIQACRPCSQPSGRGRACCTVSSADVADRCCPQHGNVVRATTHSRYCASGRRGCRR